jgi:hypothetical protein
MLKRTMLKLNLRYRLKNVLPRMLQINRWER